MVNAQYVQNPISSESIIRWSPDIEKYVRKATRTWCYRLGIRGADIEDLEQDAVLTAWGRCENGKIKYKEGLWFLARNTVLDFRARKGRIETCPLDELTVRILSNPLDKMILEELERQLPELVMLASARADGFEWELIAENLGVPCGTLRVRYSRMVKKAVEQFGDELYDLFRIERI